LGLRAHTYSTLFGLLAATGLRLGEALSLDRDGVDLHAGVLVFDGASDRRSRLRAHGALECRGDERYSRAMTFRVHMLGGADEVGASCLVVEAGNRRIMIDAGVRMGGGRSDRLPDLARASDLGGLDAVLVTHAHLDHTGALPLVHTAFPRAPVVMTAPTLSLLRVLLLDAIKVMASKAEQEEEIPLYPQASVEALLARAVGVRFLEPVVLCDGEVRATFFPAGHVLGAACVGIETAEGNVLVTGDVSVTDQLTVPGLRRPAFAPDLLVCESTYGARLHASRRAEESRLAEAVLDVLRAGGKVLVPAFALGRAQEVILVLRKALARPDAPAAPVLVDGMVRAVCGIYSQHEEFLSPLLRERAGAARGLFFTGDGRISPVESPTDREVAVTGGPVVIVSSSGMLAGGPSAEYASRLASDPGALIAITGYQDEEAPGRRLQEVERGERDELSLGGQLVKVRCRVATYGLSAHADADELAGLAATLRPGAVALVHGDRAAREGLARNLGDRGIQVVHLPAAGDSIEVRRGRGTRSRPRLPGIGSGRPLDLGALAELHRHHWTEARPAGRTYTARDLAEEWYGTAEAPLDLSGLHELLGSGQRFFVADHKRPFIFRWADPSVDRSAPSLDSPDVEAPRMEQNAALALADEVLGPASGLYRRGADRETWTLRLSFLFPDVARERHAARLAELAERTGWAVEVNPEANLAALSRTALDVLPEGTTAMRAPSVTTDRKHVKLTVDRLPPPEQLDKAVERFERERGSAPPLQGAAGRPPGARSTYDDSGRMEVNLAFVEIDRAFVNEAHRPYRKSKRNDGEGAYLEVSFVTPEVGHRYDNIIDELRHVTCWRIVIAERVEQQAVLALAGELIPASWTLRKGPGLDVASRRVVLRLSVPPPATELDAFARELDERTGFGVEIK
jgi:Cft2 family RNA processing exonuclease